MNEKQLCSRALRKGGYAHPCLNTARVVVNGWSYCGVHDPERLERVRARNAMDRKITNRNDILDAKETVMREAIDAVHITISEPYRWNRLILAVRVLDTLERAE